MKRMDVQSKEIDGNVTRKGVKCKKLAEGAFLDCASKKGYIYTLFL
jgi:hypothetical protein